ncbi:solute carrier organic anion transporter family member 4A1-like [Rhipicephalus sanguineus]|uniref:solute carrier organic anion transporter family member 4A1-like n=1 Tax=Rhipicephalus sanguineus TaxID=34632 RepID=UPI0020C29780|nr:solute carrier organic anion transporter family member 4A1-like [Rhipicephalus sanguineus]
MPKSATPSAARRLTVTSDVPTPPAPQAGPIVLVGGGFCSIIGGALVGRWNLDYAGIMRFCMFNCCFSWFGVLAFFFNCPESTYATPDGYVGAPKPTSFNFTCNFDCNCTSSVLNPVCGADSVVYLSPCLAGCHRELQPKNIKTALYSECSCVNGTLNDVADVSAEWLLLESVQAIRSRCPVNCPLLLVYLVGIFLSLSSPFLNGAAATAAAIRCVKPAERSLALGILTVIYRLAGTIPSPVIMGGIVDEACLAWHRPCGSSGNCIAYKNEDMARGMFYALIVMLAMSMLLFYLSLLAHRRHSRRHKDARQLDKMASPARRRDDELPLAEGSTHHTVQKTQSHKKGRKHGHKGIVYHNLFDERALILPTCQGSQRSSIGKSIRPMAARRWPADRGRRSHTAAKSSSAAWLPVALRRATNCRRSPPEDKPPTEELSPNDDAAARTAGAAEVEDGEDAAALVSPGSLVSPTSASAARKQSAERKDTTAADVTNGDVAERSKKKRGKKKRSKGAEAEAPSPAQAMLSPSSPTSQEEQEGLSKSLSGNAAPLIDSLSSDERLKSPDQPATTSGPLSPTELKEAGKEISPQGGQVPIPRQQIPSDITSPTPPKADSVPVERKRREVLCGMMGLYPGFLQSYRTPRCALTVLCLVSFTRSFSMTGVMMVVLPTLERRFQLKGYESGMILSSNDVASCLTMLPVAFLATQRNKPRFIGYGVATLGLGNLVVAMAHFLSPAYRLSEAGTDLCPMTVFSSSCTKTGSIRNYRFILMAGQLISGLGATPINTVTIAYLDENLPKRQSSLYIGIFNSMTIIGPALGFIVGGYTLTYYVDISTDVSSIGLTPKSPAWVGAWWLGSLVTAAMGLTLGVMACSFPKYLPEMFSTGLTAMLTKFFESQLGLPSARIAYMVGPIVLVGGGFGAIIGGALVSRWNLDYEGIMRLCMYNCCFSWFGVLIFTFSCPQGIYATPDGFVGEVVTSSFSWHCNADCNCTASLLNPICGADGVVYLSPCLAGCHRDLQVKDLKMYSGCTCINGTMSEVPGVSSDRLLLEAVQATRSRCPTDCALLFPFLAGVFLSLSACFLNAAPSTAASIRCVKPAQRSLALGIRQVIGRLVGSIPAPVIFGGILDQTCLSWHQSCGKSGNCIVYENEGMSRGLFYALAVTLSINMMCYYASLVSHRRHTRQRAMAKKSRALRRN